MYKRKKPSYTTHVNKPFFNYLEGVTDCKINELKKVKRTIKAPSSVLIYGKDGQWTDLQSVWDCAHVIEVCKNSPHVCCLLTDDTANIPEAVRLWGINYRQQEWPQNVWLGFKVKNQADFDRNWAAFTDEADGVLGRFPDVNVFVVYEAEGALVLPDDFYFNARLNAFVRSCPSRWLIASANTDNRLTELKWLVKIENQCLEKDVLFYLEKWGKWRPFVSDESGVWVKNKKRNGQKKLMPDTYTQTPLNTSPK